MTINLLPWREIQENRRLYRYFLYLLIGLFVTLLLILFLRTYLNTRISRYELRNLHLSQQITTFQINGEDEKLAAYYQTVSQQIKLIQTANLNQSKFFQEFSLLQHQLPKDVQLTRLYWMGKHIKLQGTATRSEIVGNIVKSLENSKFFPQITLESIDKNTENIVQFSIQADQDQETAS